MNGHQNHYNHNGSQRPQSEMIHSPMSEIHPVGPTSISRNGMPPRPNSVLEDPSYFPPLSPPPDFHSGYMSDVPTSSLNNGGHPRRPRRSSRPSETALILSSFKPIPSISQPTPKKYSVTLMLSSITWVWIAKVPFEIMVLSNRTLFLAYKMLLLAYRTLLLMTLMTLL